MNPLVVSALPLDYWMLAPAGAVPEGAEGPAGQMSSRRR